jgi:outer membrane protein TolC
MKKLFLSKIISILVIYIIFIIFDFQLAGKQINPSSIEVTERSSLSDLLTYAALNNPGLKAAFNNWKAVLENVTISKSLPDPKFTFAYFIKEVETRVGPQRSKIGIMQMLPWFGKLKLKGNAVLKAADSEKQKYEQAKLNLFYQVKNNYFKYYYINQNISILKANIKLLKYLESTVKTKYRSGIAPYADLIKIQIEKDKLLDQLRSAEELIEPITSKLNAVLNRQLAAPLPVPQYPRLSDRKFSKNQLREWLKENNPELKSIDFLTEKSRIYLKLAKKNYFPDFSLGLDYILTDEAGMEGIPESGKDPIVAMAQISLPIWFSKNKASVNRAKASLNSALNKRKEKENMLLAKLELVLYKLKDSEQKISLYRDSLIPQARQAVEVIQSAYKTGNKDILNFIDSQRTLLDFELKLQWSLTNYAQRMAELEMLLSKDLFL